MHNTVGGEYNATPPTLSDKQLSRLQQDAGGNLKMVAVDPATNQPIQASDPVKTIGSFSGISLSASGVAFAVPGTLIRLIVDDPGSSGTVAVYDNASAASGTEYGPKKIGTEAVIPYELHMANGAYIALTGSAKVTAIYKAD